jgi:hypothetical protein
MTNVDGIAVRLDQEAAPEDLILVTEPLMSPTFDRYYRGPTPWITLPEVEHPRFQDQPALREKMIRPDLRAELDRITSTLRAGHRVWMVGPLRLPDPRTTPPDPPPAPPPEARWQDFRDAWSAQAGAVIGHEARSVRRVVARREGSVNQFENTPLFVADPRAD